MHLTLFKIRSPKIAVLSVVAGCVLVPMLWLTSCEKNSSNNLLFGEEQATAIFNLNLGLVSLMENASLDSLSLSLGSSTVVRVLDSTVSDGNNAVLEIDFGSGNQCRDGQRRYGIWQLQYNGNALGKSDSIWLFVQQTSSDTSTLNAAIGWKGAPMKLSGTLLYLPKNGNVTTLEEHVEFFNFTWKTKVEMSLSASESINQINQRIGWIDVWKGTVNHRFGAVNSYLVSSSDLFRSQQCPKTYTTGSLFLKSIENSEEKITKVLFNPFGDTPIPCDEHAKLEQGRLEKMIILW